jgi:glycosyltransferase involved in cell wall biosynthesis
VRIWILPSAFFPHRGGVEEATSQLARELRRQGHEVLVITNQHPRSLPATDTIDGIEVRRMRFDSPRRSVRATAASALSTVRTLTVLWKLGEPEILHVNCASSQLLVAMSFARLRRIPLVLTTQGEVDNDADRLFQRSVYARQMLRAAARFAALTACSISAAEGAASVAPEFESAVVIPNGIDVAEWSIGPKVDEHVAAAWGRHVDQKGFDLLIKAWPLVRTRHPGARLILGGEGRETATLRKLAGDGIEFRGGLDRAGVQQLLNESRIAVVPSRFEAFGIVALEAMAAGRPVVWGSTTGLREATGGLGWPADPEDPVALSEAVGAAFEAPYDPVVWRSHAESLGWRDICGRYVGVYERARAEQWSMRTAPGSTARPPAAR